jgi:CysZ protein
MLAIFRAYARALRSLFLPGMLRHFVWPGLVSVALWLGIGLVFWGRLSRALAGLIQRWPALHAHLSPGGAGEHGIATAMHWALYIVSLPLMVATSVLLLELVALPIILERVARAEYGHVERRRGGSQWTSIRRTAVSCLIAVGLVAVTLPLWLIPGFGVLFSLLLSSWLNYRSFTYDVLMNHASAAELQALPERHRARLLVLALGAGTLTLVPVVNLLAVPFAGLAFAHYLLAALHVQRTAQGQASPRTV